jgi:hypothetical protein
MAARSRLAQLALAACSLMLIALAPSGDSPRLTECRNGFCTKQMTAPELLHATEQLILAHDFVKARPLLDALHQAPELSMETHFLEGYVAAESGQLDSAAKEFRQVLVMRPDLVRARLELARVLMLEGKDAAADHHFRLAEEASDLPPDIEKTIRDARGIIRGRRNWTLNVNFGIAPDSNINSATDAHTINFNLPGGSIDLPLANNARRRTGLGQTASIDGSIRLRLKDGVAILADAEGQVLNYKGKDADDISGLLAAGPEVTLKRTRASVQAVVADRWYGGTLAQHAVGGRFNLQQMLPKGQRFGMQIDLRHLESDYGTAYGGTEFAAYATYERVVNKSMIASVTGFGRREALHEPAYADTEIGANVGIGGELPHGINAGFSAGISHALFDAPILAFDTEARRDWRYNARVYAGFRSIRVMGFSPEVTYTFSKIASSLPIYSNTRHRVQFSLARYF